jgi:hypothetical protein
MATGLLDSTLEELVDMKRYLPTFVLTAALAVPVLAPATVWAYAQDEHHDRDHDHSQRYWDAQHHKWHEWNEHEERAYKMWLHERHEHYREWKRLNREEQRAYWNWRYNHPDAVLHFDIH